MDKPRVILEKDRFGLTIERLSHQLAESYPDMDNTCIIGIQEKGVVLAERIITRLNRIFPKKVIPFGKLDITFYRDDFRIRKTPLKASTTEIDFLVEGRNVILVDDVLYTGRTVHAAISALQDFGRPEKIEFLTLVDRRFNRHFPIKADYKGIVVDALDKAYVKVEWEGIDREDQVLLYSAKDLSGK